MRHVLCSLFALIVLATSGRVAADQEQCDDNRIMRIDVVELIDHRAEVQGSVDVTLMHAEFMYLFSSKDNVKKFQRDPARYEIQLDGACARMGPLSGTGTTSYWATHKDKLYIFASEACRETFKSSPERLLDGPDPFPEGDEAAKARGRELVELAVKAIGGAQQLDGVRTIRAERTWVVPEQNNMQRLEAVTMHFPDALRIDDNWGDWKSATVSLGDRGWFQAWGAPTPLGRVAIAALRDDGQRQLVSILRARHRPDFVAVAQGSVMQPLADGSTQTLEAVAVAFAGTTTTLGIDAETGRVLSLEYIGRGPSLFFGPLQSIFGDFREVGGLMLPHSREVRFEGTLVEEQSGALSIEVDQPQHLDLFKQPEVPPAETPVPAADSA